MGLIERLRSSFSERDAVTYPAMSLAQYADLTSFGFNGNQYLVSSLNQTLNGYAEEAATSFGGLVQQAYLTNSVVFACELARLQLFSEARFQYQRLRNGRPAELFGDDSLKIMEHPWPTAVTGDLLTRVLIDADLGGTAFMVRRDRTHIRRLRPDWVTMVLGSESDRAVQAGDVDADVLGIIYHPGGRTSGRDPDVFLREEVAIFAPNPDPLGEYRGIPWVLPVIQEIIADKQLTAHKSAYLVNGATPNLTVAIDKDLKEAADPKAFAEWVAAFKKSNDSSGMWDKYKTWYLAGGTVVTKVGSDLGTEGVDFKSVQGAGETRIAAAAGVPPVIVGLSEGLQAATYSNYGQARRRFADNTMRPLWRNFAGSLETIVPPPPGTRLWYDDRDIQALAEDKKDLAEVRTFESQQIRTLVDAGWEADAVIDAVTNGDMSRLKGNHTGLFSVQLQAPGATKMPVGEAPGEKPVEGTGGAETPAAGAKPAGPVGTPSNPKRDDELMLAMWRYAMERSQPPKMPDIHVDATTTIEAGAVQVTTPEVRVDAPVTIEEGAVRVEPSPVTISDGAIRNEMTFQPPDVTVVEAPEPVLTRTVIDFDEAGEIVGSHEERADV